MSTNNPIPAESTPDHNAAYAAALLGRLGGSANTDAQNAARRANGRKGGRPRKSSTGGKRPARKTAKQA